MYAAESTASSRLLPASSVDITMDLVLWPTPAAGLFGLETSTRCARENTLCALLQDVRARLETRPSQISRPPPRQRPYVAAREHVPTVQAALKDFVKAMHEFDANFSDANSIAVGRATLTWARWKMTQTAVTRVGSLAEFDADKGGTAYHTACSLSDAAELQQKKEDALAAESLFVSEGEDVSTDKEKDDE
ncbi:hypothetical protein LTR91_018953 [Friedmanniomyces endolithicus]|uniref:Uncharacterized protein n=1 Tax=Friedmanniomyces endolithicus TaxID=329885 RepID=A0AAN6HEP5_9PEZI|nr:hypothetical protein LTR94_016662 [Friedmanniomyces endolithicus]KAK0769222.1 hypothetical protein LTR59_017165 [Friedmanniomyces endolithicus]KAK0785664.1 hypothetical protein LTR38_012264 [Friedmanniomyces endolithicus]KAK0816788.1 hypothetical protein LTR75_003471 [Friedmanniomyces endolithicus]KAK0854154.1 hypothetical protein LTR03_002525 [Friedmanniomyces endolithicus]